VQGLTTRMRRGAAAAVRRAGEVRLFASAMASRAHPVLAQVVVVRRCNLACAYCSEFDRVSRPVPLDEMLRRIDRLGELHSSMIMLTGGEPLLHPGIEAIIARIRRTGAAAAMITNGYLLTPERIDALGRAGLQYLQISIDNVVPDAVSRKSLAVLDRRLQWLADRATFAVTINTVLAPGLRDPKDALAIARRARALGFNSTVGILHDGGGRAEPLPAGHLAVYEEIRRLETGVFTFSHLDRFQHNLAHGRPNDWHCGAGSRYLYVDEGGLVHYCSQQRGRPGIRLEDYTLARLEREWHVEKRCAPRCSLSCVHQVAFLDEIRDRPREMLRQMVATRRAIDPSFEPPWLLKLAAWAFLENRHVAACGRALARLCARWIGARGWGAGGGERGGLGALRGADPPSAPRLTPDYSDQPWR
jgi:MoaA/NifB/PqqE/SkfB family radical SAM enzyme